MSWSLAVTAPNRESAVSKRLDQYRFDHHIFRIRRQVVNRGRIVVDHIPAFPGYVFVEAQQSWSFIRDQISDVIDFVSFGARYATIPDNDVDRLLRSASPGKILEVPDVSTDRFAHGDPIRVRSGIASGYHGTFQRMIAPDRALVLIDWLGRMVPVSVYEDDLEKREARKRRRRRHRSRHARSCTIAVEPGNSTLAAPAT